MPKIKMLLHVNDSLLRYGRRMEAFFITLQNSVLKKSYFCLKGMAD